MTNDYLAAIRALWTNDVASHEGPFTSFRDVRATPRPLRSPHPPIWVGGSSDAAFRRAVRFGDGWHPIRSRIAWLRDVGLPRLREVAASEGQAVPALCPRIRLRLTEAPMPEDQRVVGEGALEQLHGDLKALQALGATYVLLDTHADDPEATRDHERAFRMLATVAEKIVDLDRGTMR